MLAEALRGSYTMLLWALLVLIIIAVAAYYLLRKRPAAGSAAAEGLGAQYRTCTACPPGWAQSPSDPLSCSPPAGYTGACAVVSNFNGYTAGQESQWAKTCGVLWPSPCGGVIGQRDTAGPAGQYLCSTCPDGWAPSPADPLVCAPPSSYAGACNKVSNFHGYSADKAKLWSGACAAPWKQPCDMSTQ